MATKKITQYPAQEERKLRWHDCKFCTYTTPDQRLLQEHRLKHGNSPWQDLAIKDFMVFHFVVLESFLLNRQFPDKIFWGLLK